MSRVGTITFDDLFSYLCLYVDNEMVSFYVNEKPVNEMYLEQLDNMRSVEDPTKIVMSISDTHYKALVDFIQPYTKEALEKIDMKVYDHFTMVSKYPECFTFE